MAPTLPVSDSPRTGWLAILVPLARLRFLLILGVIGLVIAKWDWLVANYEKWARPADHEHAADSHYEYYCPMHPNVVRNTNKEKCPICFMPLSKRMKGEMTDEALPAGTVARVQLSPYRVVLAGVQTVPVGYHDLRKEITTVGTVEFDERGLRTVAARFKGRIDKLFVNQTGQWVRAGDPLASLYSPDLLVTVQNFLDARQAKKPDLEKTARDRLKQWGIEGDQLDEIVKSGKPIQHLTIKSPIDGHVLKKYPREGQYVDEGAPLYDVADLSTVWVQARLYEDDLTFLPKGHDPKTGAPSNPLPVSATVRGRPGETFEGKLSFVFPHVDPESRTLTIRFELDNPDHELRPGMTATVNLRIGLADLKDAVGGRLRIEGDKVLAVPGSSVIDTGAQKVVYRESQPNTFDGVEVDLGPRLIGPAGETYFPVLKGLEPGDRVATSGSFLLDAETRLNPAAGSIYLGGSGGGRSSAVRPSTPEDVDAKVVAALRELSPADRALAEKQRFCPIIEGSRLGSMGKPVKLVLDGQPVFVCCKSCVKEAEADPAKTLKRVAELKSKDGPSPLPSADPKVQERIRRGLAGLSPADRALAEAQRICPVTDQPLGSMGVPIKVEIKGQTVFVCCPGCDSEALEKPDEVLRKVEEYKKAQKQK
jgi:membrane fusion protein, copper/silver efflux system